MREQCPLVRTILQVGGGPNNNTTDFYSALEVIDANATFDSIKQNWHAPALTYFTSGTSGPPKMVRHNQISYPLGKPIGRERYIALTRIALTTTAKSWNQLSPGKVFWNTAEQGMYGKSLDIMTIE